MAGRPSLDKDERLDLVREYCSGSLTATAVEDLGFLSFRVIKDLADIGIFSLPFARECGGLGESFEAFVTALEIVGSASASYATCVAAHFCACWPIQQLGTKRQRTKHLPELLDGTALAGRQMCLNGGAVSSALASRGARGFVVTGSLDWTVNAGQCQYVTMFAPTASARLQQTCFLLNIDSAGLFVRPAPPTFGLRDARFATLTLDSAELPLGSVIGKAEYTRAIAVETHLCGQIAFAAILVGVAETAANQAIDLEHQSPRKDGLGAALAAIVSRIQSARDSVRMAAKCYDNGQIFAEPPVRTLDRARTTAVDSALAALDLLGPNSIAGQTTAARLVRDAFTLRALCQ